MIWIRITAPGYTALGYTLERLSDGLFFDGSKFVAVTDGIYPPPMDMTARTGIYSGVFEKNVEGDPTILLPGQYCVCIHRKDNGMPIATFAEDYNPITRCVLGGVVGSR
jgi:hypothetical protein